MKLKYLILILLLFLVACRDSNLTRSPLSTPDFSSPVVTPSNIVDSDRDIPFCLDRPISEGMTEIRGTGPVGVPIMIVDITFMGSVMGKGRVNREGTFAITVPEIEKNRRIGLALGDLSGTEWLEEDFYLEGYNCNEPMQVPHVGFFYDTVMVRD